MKRVANLTGLLYFLLGVGFTIWIGVRVSAQTATPSAPAYGVTSTQTVATCPAPATGITYYCSTFTGPYVSINGAAYVALPLTATTAGVTSWNGLTGAVTYTAPTPPVTSVNGKTGAVTISAVATAPTITMQ